MRERVLAAWAASPARFRADANAEEDAAGAGYRDRLVVELVQNSADSAAGAQQPSGADRTRVLFRLRDGLLEVANTGAPLTASGVEALSTLRASAKRGDGSVGHFGVGFTAVLAVSDAPAIVSRATGGVQFSRERSLQTLGDVPALRSELARRDGVVPVLRLPWPLQDGYLPPDGYDTAVRLPLHDAAAAHRLLAELDPSLLLVLPHVAEIAVEAQGTRRVLRCAWDGDDATLFERVDQAGERVHSRWCGVVSRGALTDGALAGRPVEERSRTAYEIRAFVPVSAAVTDLSGDTGRPHREEPVRVAAFLTDPPASWPADVPRVVRAPQPTDEPLTLPVLLAAPFPLESMRRHVVPGPLLDLLIGESARALLRLGERLARSASSASALNLVPTGLPAGAVDGLLRDEVRTLLPDAALLPGGRPGRDGAVLDLGAAAGPAVDVLERVVDGLLPAAFSVPSRAAALGLLGVRRMVTSDVIDLVGGLRQPASWWAGLYAALRLVPDRDALGALPVPLADGRQVTGPRGVLLPDADLDVASLAGLPLRVADPEACAGPAREVLLQLGAVDAGPRALLADPAVHEALLEGDAGLAEPVLALVAAARVAPGELPDLAQLLLPDATGEPTPAGELVLPGGPLDGLLAADAPFGRLDAERARRWPAEVLEAVGVLRSFAVLRAEDVLLDPDEPTLLDLDGSDEWLQDDPGLPAAIEDFVAIRDLEWVDPDRWPEALAELSTSGLREVVLASPYTCWWLRAYARLPAASGARLPLPDLRLPTGDPDLAGCYEDLDHRVAAGIDGDLLRACGVVDGLPADAESRADLLDRLGDERRAVSWGSARAVYRRLTAAGPADLEPPGWLRTADGVRDARDAVVVDAADLLDLVGGRGRLVVPPDEAAAVARLLDVPLATQLAAYPICSRARRGSAPAILQALPAALTAAGLPPAEPVLPVRVHDRLLVRDADGAERRVPWRVTSAAVGIDLDAGAGPEELGRAVAWVLGRWRDRAVLMAALSDPGRAVRLAVEAAFDG